MAFMMQRRWPRLLRVGITLFLAWTLLITISLLGIHMRDQELRDSQSQPSYRFRLPLDAVNHTRKKSWRKSDTLRLKQVLENKELVNLLADVSRNKSLYDDVMLASKQKQKEKSGEGQFAQNKLTKAYWPPKAKFGDPGYRGWGVLINVSNLTQPELQQYEGALDTYKVNKMATDKIPLRREIVLDMPECSHLGFDTKTLPKAGVVLIFHNELWSVLLRTVYSILDAGPEELITEIILVDDASDKEFLGRPLEDYLQIFEGRVKLIRMPTRSGLIKARLAGFDHVTGEVAVFLDSHCEVHKGWLEPLLQRIKEDERVLAVPATDTIKHDTFEYEFKNNAIQERGGIDWDLNFNWMPQSAVDGVMRKSLADPIKSPTHLGCCFAVSKNNFERLGRYDPELQIWGCENLELSFKSWMCGGRVEIIPCSHVGHMFREAFPYTWEDDGAFKLIKNCLRVAEVWLDDYKQFYYERISNMQSQINIGDISARRALREQLQCRSFHWYVQHVYPELYIPVHTKASGRLSSLADPSLCLERDAHSSIIDQAAKIRKCHPMQQRQFFMLTKEDQIRRDQGCLDVILGNMLVMVKCDQTFNKWIYTETGHVEHTTTGLCITLSRAIGIITMEPCVSQRTDQKWSWPRRTVRIHESRS